MNWIAKYPFEKPPELDAGAFVALVTVPTKVDAAGFSLRRLGVSVKDAISYQAEEGPVVFLVGHVPISSTYVDQVVCGGTSIYHIDSCRVPMSQKDYDSTKRGGDYGGSTPGIFGVGVQMRQPVNVSGRFPTNLIMSEATAEIMDEQSGVLHARDNKTPTKRNHSHGVTGWGANGPPGPIDPGDSGGASRFYHHFETIEDVVSYLNDLFVGPTMITL